VRLKQLARAVTSIVRKLQATPRRVWWSSFVIVTSLTVLWSLASPVFAGPDEPAHVIRAVALDHGQLTGRDPRRPLGKTLQPVGASARVVRAPEVFGSVGTRPCFAGKPDEVALCLDFTGPTRDTDLVTYAAGQPPVYYAAVGVASWLWRPGVAGFYLMRFLSALVTGALIATAITALRWFSAPRLLAAGLVLAITPTVLFIGGVVHPSGPEIAAAIALWTSGLALVSSSEQRVDNRLVTATGVAGCVLALSRPLGPLWLALVLLTVLGFTDRAELRSLARSRWVRIWALLVLTSSLAQVVWDAVVRPREATLLVDRAAVHLSALEAARDALGRTFQWYQEMVGRFGWLDTTTPVLSWLPWIGTVAFFVFVAVAWSTRRQLTLLVALLAATVVVPVVVESTPYRAGGTFWQGRYSMPLAVGIPIVAAFILASTARGRELLTPRVTWTLGITVCVAQFLAYAQNLRRYTVGARGPLLYWWHPRWHPPGIPPLLLSLAYLALVIVFVAWLLVPTRAADQRPADLSIR
jgi:Predicted membrane protein (DUF2142)